MLVEDYVREIKTRECKIPMSYSLARTRSLAFMVKGRSNKEIAASLSLSPYTVETHRRNLQEKLNLHSFAELILYAVRKGIIC